jgi:hypothetical protein
VAGVARPGRNTEAAVAEKKPNKMDAMRQVLKKLGDDAPTAVLQAELKASFGIDMTVKHISTYRADIIKKRQQTKAQKPEPAAPQGRGNGKIDLADVLAVKSLVDRLGAEDLRTLIDAFER